MNMYKRHRFPPVVISYAVWLYHRFNRSHRDIEDLLAERGITVSYESIRLWCIKFGPEFVQERRDGRVAKRFFRGLIRRHGSEPWKIVTDKLGSYRVAHRELIPTSIHVTDRYAPSTRNRQPLYPAFRRAGSSLPSCELSHFGDILRL